MGRRTSSATFIGRRAELERLQAALEAAAAGVPSLVLLAGEAGVGKSRLLAEFTAHAEAGAARTLLGGCLDVGEGGLPFAPFAEALKGLAGSLGQEADTALTEVFGDSAPLLAGLVPELRRVAADAVPIPLDDPATRQARLFDAVLDVLGRFAARSPVVLVLEDLHWADGSTRDLLRFLLRNLREERLLLVATVRSDDLHRRHPLMPLLGELERSERVERLELHPFGRDEIVEQLGSILGSSPDASLVDDVAERSDGLPFYVEELAATDAARGAIPASLRDILALRLASLSDVALTLVRAAAVIRRRFTLDELAAVTDLDEAALVPGLRTATEARVLAAGEGPTGADYRFRHALLREAAYDELLPAERVAIHARMADTVAAGLANADDEEPALIADLAFHTYHAGDQPRALAAAVHATRALDKAAAFREALDHAEHALELWPRVPDAEARAGISHGDLLALAGRMAANAGRLDLALAHAQAALDELAPSASTERLAELLIDTELLAFEAGRFDVELEQVERLHGVVDKLAPSRTRVRALLEDAGYQFLNGAVPVQDAIEANEHAMAAARALNDDHLWAIAAFTAGFTLQHVGRVARAETLVDAAFAAWGSGFPGTAAWPAYGCRVLFHAGRFADCAGRAAEAKAIITRYGLERRVASWYQAMEVHALLELGRLEEAELLADPAFEHPLRGIGNDVAKIQALRGHVEEARQALSDDNDDPSVQRWDLRPVRLELEAFVDRAAGDFDGMRTLVSEGVAGRSDDTLKSWSPWRWRLLGTAIGAAADHAVEARRRRHDAEAVEAGLLAEAWLAILREIVQVGRADGGAGAWAEATLTMAEAELQRANDVGDVQGWRDAVAAWRAISHAHGTASAQLRLAEALLATGGERAEAAGSLRGAHAIAAGMGAAPLAHEIERVARHARIELAEEAPPEMPGDGAAPRSPLTGRERDVLRLVAAGHTNREIGTALFISEKTVSVHVSNGMRKLDALSRYEAAATARERGYLD